MLNVARVFFFLFFFGMGGLFVFGCHATIQVAVIHRDVAARNVLVGTRPTDVKLADLGAARSVFRTQDRAYTATSDHNPARWMAPEALKTATFNNKYVRMVAL